MTAFMEVMKEKETAGTNLNRDLKPPVTKAESRKELMIENIGFTQLFCKAAYRTHRRSGRVFRDGLQGKGKEKLCELQPMRLTPERIAKLTEEETEMLSEWAMGALEKLLRLDPERRCEIANQVRRRVWMPPDAGTGGTELSSGSYDQAHLMELQAKLVASMEPAPFSRFYDSQTSPANEQPKPFEDLHETVRRLPDLERAGQSQRKKDYFNEFKGREKVKNKNNKGGKGKGEGKGKDQVSETNEQAT